MHDIFVSYRRDDGGFAGRLHDRLPKDVKGRIFRDVITIEPGAPFREAIQQALASCSALLVIIGPSWGDNRDVAGRRRLDDPDDLVRLEIAISLVRGIIVIPVMVGTTAVPQRDLLPHEIASLADRQVFRLTDENFEHDVRRLSQFLQRKLVAGHSSRVIPAAIGTVLVLAAIVLGVVLYGPHWSLGKGGRDHRDVKQEPANVSYPDPVAVPVFVLPSGELPPALNELAGRAKNRDAVAIADIGIAFDYGTNGVAPNAQLAMKWYRTAAELGQPVAMANLGIMYEYGRGVKRDINTAISWYKKAAAAGNSVAADNLANLYRSGAAK